jgi:hypothetical protein
MAAERVGLSGRYFVTLFGPDGRVKDYREGQNVITTVGKEFVASFLKSAVAAAATFTCKYIAIGSDGTAAAVGNTTLGTEVARQTGTASYTSGAIFNIVATFAAGTGTGSITEYGLLSSSANGTLFSRDVGGVITKGAGDSLQVNYELTFS